MKYTEVTSQLERIAFTQWLADKKANETYVYLSWEDWAYCINDCGHYPQVVACGEDGYVVVADGFTRRLYAKFYFTSHGGKVHFYEGSDCWYKTHLVDSLS